MHDAALMKNLMAEIERAAATENAKKVTEVQVWIGALSHMTATHFTEHFTESSAGTMAEGARLEIAVSDDIHHPKAQEILLRSIAVDA